VTPTAGQLDETLQKERFGNPGKSLLDNGKSLLWPLSFQFNI
jgi:hypothetical protein